jgi:hypothetical protein
MSATYGPTQYNEFIHDAEELKFDTDVTTGHYDQKAWAIDSSGKITGEWSSRTGGQLAWKKPNE